MAMANVFTLENYQSLSDKMNLDELYEKKRLKDERELKLFQKMLNMVHRKIRNAVQNNSETKCCFFVVPEIMPGVGKYNQAGCIAYLLDKLISNQLEVRYIDPNVLLISWAHYVPNYVRREIKRKTGIVVNEYGQVLDEGDPEGMESSMEQAVSMVNQVSNAQLHPIQQIQNSKKYTPVTTYKPSGKLIYSDSMVREFVKHVLPKDDRG